LRKLTGLPFVGVFEAGIETTYVTSIEVTTMGIPGYTWTYMDKCIFVLASIYYLALLRKTYEDT
jgi:hypothetical protein